MNQIIEKIKEGSADDIGKYIPSDGETCFFSGDDIKAWLESAGYKVIDTFRGPSSAFCITGCGVKVFENGYAHKIR